MRRKKVRGWKGLLEKRIYSTIPSGGLIILSWQGCYLRHSPRTYFNWVTCMGGFIILSSCFVVTQQILVGEGMWAIKESLERDKVIGHIAWFWTNFPSHFRTLSLVRFHTHALHSSVDCEWHSKLLGHLGDSVLDHLPAPAWIHGHLSWADVPHQHPHPLFASADCMFCEEKNFFVELNVGRKGLEWWMFALVPSLGADVEWILPR